MHHTSESPVSGEQKEKGAVSSFMDSNIDEMDPDGPHQVKTRRGISTRQAQMIAIGGTIGTGLFVGLGEALAIGGPGFLFLAYALICILVYGIMTATVEISTYLPLTGAGMGVYGKRFVSQSFGFALGWLYVYTYSINVAYEVTAASLVINYWEGARQVNIAVWISMMLVVIIVVNFLPVRVFGEAEFWFAGLKILLIIGLLIMSFILFWGGGPNRDRLGFRYWQHPGATKEYLVGGDAGRFWAFLYVFGLSCFSFFFGPELIVVTAGEMINPRKNLPRASRHYIVRLLVFYLLSSLAIGVVCNSNSERLTNGGVGAAASPWVVAIFNAGIGGLDSVVNVGIIISAWSAGNSYLYMASRALYGLARAGDAPRIFTRCNRWGVPYFATGATSVLSLLAYLNVGNNSSTVFNWFVNLTNTAGFLSWICCCIVYLRFRKARLCQGVSVPWTSWVQPYASWLCGTMFLMLLLFNGFSTFFPGKFTAASFLTAYIGIAVFLVIYTGHRVWAHRDTWLIEPEDVDLHSGLEELHFDSRVDDEADPAPTKHGIQYMLKTALYD